MNREKQSCWYVGQFAMIGVLTLVFSSVVFAQGTGGEDAWDFTVTPFLWMTGLHGTADVGRLPADVDVEFEDILSSLRMAVMMDLKAQKGRWGVQSNIIWLEMKDETDSRGTHLTMEAKTWFVDVDGFYEITEQWSVLAGIRYYDVSLTLKGDGNRNFNHKLDHDWIDPIIGTEFQTPIGERWALGARGDIGGFGVGSDFAWQLWGGANYRFGKKNAIAFGWRHLAFDYSDGEGRDRFEMNSYLTGPYLGLELHF